LICIDPQTTAYRQLTIYFATFRDNPFSTRGAKQESFAT